MATKNLSTKAAEVAAAAGASSDAKVTVPEIHIKVRSHYHKLVASKKAAGLADSLARDVARRQIEHDHGIDVVKAALASSTLDRDEAIATAGINSNAAQSVDRRDPDQPVDVKIDETQTATE